ncbi:MAG: 1-acyl-sn-glycerol-3-phosphate acyltransferase [Pseudonocardiales bacterium]|nr:1-acyl-sn-glycerol-3-phosphate acyltransferase [Jatrophihabitans sp.]MDT4904201.1 1-acyl-sn-glycerol-3-phosphate acyltransferase [Pseudonocardiales bacterium]MDT4948883.1 1-acyl-sn-glycerol-3-phosphate acyltransferase [Pseudonocardiales bacterium]
MGYWLAKFVFLGPLLRLLWRPWAEGRENIPADGPVIIASNHLSFCDSFFMPIVIRRKVTFLAKAEYFTTPGLKGRLTRRFMYAVGMVPIDRGDSDAARAALTTGVRVLGEGTLLGIYPEGTRSPDGRLYRGKTGVARLALESGAVVVPCAMINTDVVQPQGRIFPKLRPRPGVRFGKPLDFSRYEGMSGDRFVERSMTDEIMYELMQLSGQEYVDQYAAKVKKSQGKDAAFGSPGAADVREIGDRAPKSRAS